MKRKKARLDPDSQEHLQMHAEATTWPDENGADSSSSEDAFEGTGNQPHSRHLMAHRQRVERAVSAAGVAHLSHEDGSSRAHSVGELQLRLTERMQHTQSNRGKVVQRGHKAGRPFAGEVPHATSSMLMSLAGSSSSSSELRAQHAGLGEDEQIEEWERALRQAGGAKSKKASKLIRQALKRHKLGRSRLGVRMKSVAKSMAERHEKRKQQRKEREAQKARLAKASLRAGFEGRRSSFL